VWEGEAWTDAAAAACRQVRAADFRRVSHVVYRCIGRNLTEAAGQGGCNSMQWVVGTLCWAGLMLHGVVRQVPYRVLLSRWFWNAW
jgi:hypothetical protein